MAADAFPTFELIPPGVTLTADDELAASVGAEFVPELLTADEPQPMGRTWMMDYDTGRATTSVSGVQAAVEIAQVALRTKRGEHIIFPDDFGMDDPDALIGQSDSVALRADYIRDCTETLMSCHERITDVGEFDFQYNQDDEFIAVSFAIEIDGQDVVQLQDVPVATGGLVA